MNNIPGITLADETSEHSYNPDYLNGGGYLQSVINNMDYSGFFSDYSAPEIIDGGVVEKKAAGGSLLPYLLIALAIYVGVKL